MLSEISATSDTLGLFNVVATVALWMRMEHRLTRLETLEDRREQDSKKHKTGLLLALSLLLGCQEVKALTLSWEYPTNVVDNDSTLKFVVLDKTNVGDAWTALTNVPSLSTNEAGTNALYQISVPAAPGQLFLTVQASNFWGVSSQAQTAAVPAPLTNAPTSLDIFNTTFNNLPPTP